MKKEEYKNEEMNKKMYRKLKRTYLKLFSSKKRKKKIISLFLSLRFHLFFNIYGSRVSLITTLQCYESPNLYVAMSLNHNLQLTIQEFFKSLIRKTKRLLSL